MQEEQVRAGIAQNAPIELETRDGSTQRLYILTCGYGLGYLVEAPTGLFLFDCGVPGSAGVVLEKMRELGRADLKVIWITHAHYDHYGSAARLRELTGAKIGIHALDAEDLAHGKSKLGTPRRYGAIYFALQPLVSFSRRLEPTPADFTLEDYETLERFGLDATVLHTPGHTPGHSSVLLGDGSALAGDLLGGFPKPALQNLLATDWDALPKSLEHLKQAKPARVYSGHRHKSISGEEFQSINR